MSVKALLNVVSRYLLVRGSHLNGVEILKATLVQLHASPIRVALDGATVVAVGGGASRSAHGVAVGQLSARWHEDGNVLVGGEVGQE